MASKAEIEQFFENYFPQAELTIVSVGDGRSIIKKDIDHRHLRPGNTVSGPTIMGIADAALGVAVLGAVDDLSQLVTSNLNINFLKRPAPDLNLIAKCTLIKTGRLLAVGEVFVYSEGEDDPVAHATGTYAIFRK